jgi:nucleoside-diphosphate-sugar epimerase
LKILITGGSGFIGSYFHRDLRGLGQTDLVTLDLVEPGGIAAQAPFVKGDIRDPKVLDRAMAGVDLVINLAAAHHDFGIAHDTYYSVNEHGSEMVCAAMDRAGITNAVFYSTVATYGTAPTPHHEDATTQPDSPYGGSKLKGEGVFRRWVETGVETGIETGVEKGDGRRALVIRPTVTFGPNNFANMYSLIRQIDSGKYLRFGEGTNIKSLSYVENIVDATLFLLGLKPDKPNRAIGDFEIFNFIDKPDMTSTQISDTVSKSLGKKPAPCVPYGVGMVMGLPFDAVIKATGKNLPISSARIRKLYRTETKFEADKILSTGFRPTIPLAEGIDRMVRWYQAEGKARDAVWHLPPAEPVPS